MKNINKMNLQVLRVVGTRRATFLLVGLLLVGASSCADWLDIRPQSQTVLEDFWQDENDVKSMLATCYSGMKEGGFMDRVVVWGEVRSDNVVTGSNLDANDNVARILNLTLNAENGYTSWFEFYRVINYCNTLIYYAPGVRERDPNFTEGQLNAYLAEAKGIRALCYFILVRTFRDIPFSLEPVFDDSRSFEIAQSDPDVVINTLLADLKSAESVATVEFDNVQYDKARITRKAIQTLIADMALWMEDYGTAIEYCDKVINSAGTKLVLETSTANYSDNLFMNSGTYHSSEEIFTLAFTGNATNDPVNSLYGNRLASFEFGKTELFGDISSPTAIMLADTRARDFFCPIDVSGYFSIAKYVRLRATRPVGISATDYFTFSCRKWIFYRLADVYLIKAEALVERNTGSDLPDAVAAVAKTYDRANSLRPLDASVYTGQNDIRALVFDERQREFLFEGKRYYDLLRRIKRERSTTAVVSQYLVRKYATITQATALSKINDKDALYMPMNANELKVNTLLKQNPFYEMSSDINKN